MAGNQKKILVLRYRFIGDTILTIPFLRNLRYAEPGAHIAWVVAPGSSDVVAGIPYVDELIYWDPVTIHADSRGTHRTFADKLGFVRGLRERHFDKAYVLKRSLGSAILALLGGAKERIGFASEGRSLLLTKTVPYRHDRHEVQNFLDVLRADGVPVVDDYLEAWITREEELFAEKFYADAGVKPGETLIGIHPFAANAPRAWHLDNFIELANRLQSVVKCRVVFFGGPKDSEAAARLADEVTPKPVLAIGKTTLRESMALLKRLKLLVCNDSGIMHLAASLQVPLVALFGPQSPVKFGPWGDKCLVLYSKFPCSPCRQKFFTECKPSGRGTPECMEFITTDLVLNDIGSLLKWQSPEEVVLG
ncbi:MAG: glycosyltransferase family 9 protein [Geobacteraceae bacterium]|nr:glycosyltransferase family 9 protein [Geobacteraceae bacterium]